MKKPIIALSVAFFTMVFFLGFSTPAEKGNASDVTKTTKFKIPADIQPIIKNSCFGCHNSESKNDKAKGKLSFDQLESMKKGDVVAALAKINEVIKKGDMPPAKFLERFEKAKPSDEDVQKLLNWTSDEANKMMKKKKNKKETM